jgi:hypothetical protein
MNSQYYPRHNSTGSTGQILSIAISLGLHGSILMLPLPAEQKPAATPEASPKTELNSPQESPQPIETTDSAPESATPSSESSNPEVTPQIESNPATTNPSPAAESVEPEASPKSESVNEAAPKETATEEERGD